MARTLRDIEGARLRCKARPEDFGFDLRKQPVSQTSSWKVHVIECLLMFILFGSHKMYRKRLHRVRLGKSANLLGFRQLLREFLAEWTGKLVSVHTHIVIILIGSIKTLIYW